MTFLSPKLRYAGYRLSADNKTEPLHQYLEEFPYGIEISLWHAGELVGLGIAEDKQNVEEISCQLQRQISVDLPVLRKMDTRPPQVITVALHGSPFQFKVWAALKSYEGDVLSYKELAQLIGQPQAARAVGSALAKNPVARHIPCHKVLPVSEAPGKYRWGVQVKRKLLEQASSDRGSFVSKK